MKYDRVQSLIGKLKQRKQQEPYQMTIRPPHALVAAFVMPMIIMMIIFMQKGIFPFGEESFLCFDMSDQYAPFFSEFQHKLKNGQSLLYSWNIGMGVNFAALYAYYLASPLNWLLILCPDKLVIEFMTYSIVLKIGLSGLSMAWYLRKHCQKIDLGVAFFGIFYAMSGYVAAYSWNIMWLDCILLFPLIVLGLERLVQEKKGMLYCIALGLSILSNYYISIMICIFMVLYFTALLILEEQMSRRKFAVRCGWFTLYSLLAGGMAAVVLLPEIYALQMTASSDISFPETYSSYFSIFDMIARHMSLVETELELNHWPNIYCGVAVLMFFLLYLGSRRIKAKEKAVYCTLLLFFFASFSVNVLDFIWHGFHYPIGMPCRQSFIYIFLMLLICYRAYMYLDVIPKRHITLAFFVACGFIILAENLITEKYFHAYVYYAAILFLAIYAGLLFLYRKGRRYYTLALLLALSTVFVEAAINMTVTGVRITNRTSYVEDNQAIEKLLDTLLPNSEFFRVEKVAGKTMNDGAWLNFPSVSLFSSMANAGVSDFFKKIGCQSFKNKYSITGSTPLVDMLLGVKYGIYTDEPPHSGIRTLVDVEQNIYLYENTYSMPVAWVVPSSFEQDWYLDACNPADVQNRLADITGSSHVLIQVMDGEADEERCHFTPERDGDYYVFISNKEVEEVSVTRESSTETFKYVDRGYFIELGFCEAEEEVVIRSDTEGQNLDAMVYRFAEEALVQVYESLNQAPLVLSSWDETSLNGTIDVNQEGVLFTTIPYDKGWKVMVDGIPCETKKIVGAFLSIDVSEGNHVITFDYWPEGLTMGIWITAGSLILLLVVFAWTRQMTKLKKEEVLLEETEIQE